MRPPAGLHLELDPRPAGNIAAEDFEFRQTLIANGVIRPLAQLVVGARKALEAGGEALCGGMGVCLSV